MTKSAAAKSAAREAAAGVPDLTDSLQAARMAIALAVKRGDPIAERVARRRLAGWKLADALNRAQANGLVLSPEEAAEWKRLIVGLCMGADPGHPTSGGEAVRMMKATLDVAESGYPGDDPPDATCDSCGAPDATLSASGDLTGTDTVPIVLDRLCAACRSAAQASRGDG
jgi:hypothetical protein